MKLNNIIVMFLLSGVFFAALISCEKADSEKAYGFSEIYMPQAISLSAGINNDYPVPSGIDSSTYNYNIDTKENKVNIILGTYLSGPITNNYSVDIAVNNDTIKQLFDSKVWDTATYKLMPSSMYTLPAKLDVTGRKGTFDLALDIAQLKLAAYKGKKLVLAVKIANPTKYELNTALSTTMVIVNVDALVIGPRVDYIGGAYLKNPGNPFITSALQSGQTRWGTLADWKTNAAALTHGGTGGFSSNLMDLESGWGSAQILNGKIYQTITLPAGKYYFDISGGDWAGGENFLKEPAYEVMAPDMDTIPDHNNIVGNNAIQYQTLTKAPQALLIFTLTATTKVTLGVVVNYNQTEQGFKTKQVFLYSYPKAL